MKEITAKKSKAKKGSAAFKQNVNQNISPSRKRASYIAVAGVAERDMTRYDREGALAKARLLAEQNPFIKGLVMQKVDNEVSTGFHLKMRTGDTGWDKANMELWDEEKNFLDIRRIRSWRKLIAAIDWRKTIDGDIGILHNFIDPVDGSFRVQLVEADRIHSRKFDYLDQGCEFDDYGRPLRYFYSPRPKDQQDFKAMYADGTVVDASDFHLCAHYSTERIDMLRGTSMLLPMFNKLVDIEEIMDAFMQKIKNAAMLVFKSTMEYQETGIGPNWGTDDDDDSDKEKRRKYKMAPGSKLDLAPGEDLSVVESKDPNAVVEPFLKFIMRYTGVSIGLPLEYMMLDLGSLNYSSARAMMEMAKRRFRCEQESLTIPASKIFMSWQQHKIDVGDLVVPNGMKKPSRHGWALPSWPYLDPQKDVQANGLAIGFGLTSRKRVLAEIGEDWDEVALELESEQKTIDEKKLAVNVGLPGSKQAGKPLDEVEAADAAATVERGTDVKA